ncbi:MAG: 5-formyltetrahydrofolate cyclo-ligase [Pyrinomonadaceae bacterium]|nr:5-formyltetrahydrofolate cyclo-ligase [Pyrinomonadaceae bacterium]
MTKSDLRKTFLARRRALSNSEIAEMSGKIVDRFFDAFSLDAIQLVHIYSPIRKFNEVPTEPFLERFRRDYKRIRIAFPRVNRAAAKLEHLVVDEHSKMISSSWGISEPAGSDLIEPAMIDLVIVPLLAFDLRGFRVGYGKGFYDEFLSKCRPNCLKIGLSFFPPVDEISDIYENDVSLDHCITPNEIVSFP